MTSDDLRKITSKKGYGVTSSFGGGGALKSSFHKGSVNFEVSHSGEGSDAKRSIGPTPLRPERTALNYSGQCTVRIKVFRFRLCDPDGNCIKYHLDFLRYCGAIKDDNDAAIRLVFEPQEKVATKEQERCEIVIEYPSIDPDNLWCKVKA